MAAKSSVKGQHHHFGKELARKHVKQAAQAEVRNARQQQDQGEVVRALKNESLHF